MIRPKGLNDSCRCKPYVSKTCIFAAWLAQNTRCTVCARTAGFPDPQLTELRIEFQFRVGTHYVIENPSGSLLFEMPALKARISMGSYTFVIHQEDSTQTCCQDRFRKHGAVTVRLCLGAVGAASAKCAS